jgi:hypothetical protein
MSKTVPLILLAGILTLLTSCSHEGSSPSSESDWGTGLNTVERKYGKSASDTYDAALAAVKSFDLTVDRDRHDEMGGEVVGRRADRRKVTVRVDAIDKSNSRASVRVEPGDSALARMVQEKIADKLGMGRAKAAYFGGNSEDAVYEADLQTSLSAAEGTAKALNWIVTDKELSETWAQLDARTADSNPARFRITHVDDRTRRTKVAFMAGNGRDDTSKTMISRMHEEFDLQIAGHAVGTR